MADDKSPPSSGADFLKSFRDLSFIIAIYLYFAGWIYLYFDYNYFGLSIRQVDMEFYSFLIYSVDVLYYLVSHWLITSLVIICSVFLVHFIKHTWIIYIVCVLLFSLLYYCSIQAARTDAKADFCYHGSRLKNIYFVLKDESDSTKKPAANTGSGKETTPLAGGLINADIAGLNKQYKLRLLLESKEDYFVIASDTGINEKTVDQHLKIVYAVKKEKVNLTISY
jgi:hypothetical protein